MITAACVLKTGGEYNRHHVEKLRDMVGDCDFVCLSDDPSVPGYVPLKHNLPGWWSKIELFALPGPILYFDLDTVVLDEIDDLMAAIEQHDFLILRDVYRGKDDPMAMQSSVMGWRGDMSYVYDLFMVDPAAWMTSLRDDQRFLEKVVEGATYWQDVLPGALVSFKVNVQGKHVPKDAQVIFFHGQPRPWQQNEVNYGRR